MTTMESTILELLLQRGTRSWLEFYQQEIVPRKQFNDRYLVGKQIDEIKEYKTVIEQMLDLLSEEIEKAERKTFFLGRRRLNGKINARIESKLLVLQARLKELVGPPPQKGLLRRSSRKRNGIDAI